MTCSIRATIRALVAPRHSLSCSRSIWRKGLVELKRRGEGRHESGAFLLGYIISGRRAITDFVYYDDLDPRCLDAGGVIIDGTAYGMLWKYCRKTGLQVIGDVHTHPGRPWQSPTDQKNPMIGNTGHIALIVPDYAERLVGSADLGIYEYRGEHQWKEYLGMAANKFFYIGLWG